MVKKDKWKRLREKVGMLLAAGGVALTLGYGCNYAAAEEITADVDAMFQDKIYGTVNTPISINMSGKTFGGQNERNLMVRANGASAFLYGDDTSIYSLDSVVAWGNGKIKITGKELKTNILYTTNRQGKPINDVSIKMKDSISFFNDDWNDPSYSYGNPSNHYDRGGIFVNGNNKINLEAETIKTRYIINRQANSGGRTDSSISIKSDNFIVNRLGKNDEISGRQGVFTLYGTDLKMDAVNILIGGEYEGIKSADVINMQARRGTDISTGDRTEKFSIDGKVAVYEDASVTIKAKNIATAGIISFGGTASKSSGRALIEVKNHGSLEGTVNDAFDGKNIAETVDFTKYDGKDYGKAEVILHDGAEWNFNGKSAVNRLENSGKVNLSVNADEAERNALFINNYSGNGAFVMGSKSAGIANTDAEGKNGGVTINNYSGKSSVYYAVKAADPANLIGGNFTVNKAVENSEITLWTDYAGSEEKQKEALKSLAHKLYYMDQEDAAAEKLKATVGTGEGLTTLATTSKVHFTKDGEGRTEFEATEKPEEPEEPEIIIPDKQIKFEFDTPITGNFAKDAAPTQEIYLTSGVVRDGATYTFDKNTTIYVKGAEENAINPMAPLGKVVINAPKANLTVKGENESKELRLIEVKPAANEEAMAKTLELKAKKLKLQGKKKDGSVTGIYAWDALTDKEKAAKIIINTNTDMDLSSENNQVIGILAHNNASVDFNGYVKIKAQKGWNAADANLFDEDETAAVIAQANTNIFYMPEITPEINFNKRLEIKTNGNGISAKSAGSTVNVAYGKIEITPSKGDTDGRYVALRSMGGVINMNVIKDDKGNVVGAGDKKVEIKGNLLLSAKNAASNDPRSCKSVINLALNEEKSYWEGVLYNAYRDAGTQDWGWQEKHYGEGNIWLANGARWTNIKHGELPSEAPASFLEMNKHGINFTGSRVHNFTGGSSRENAGFIYQQDEKAITVDNYSGTTVVMYDMDDKGDAFAVKGGEIVIKKAAAGSHIVLMADSVPLNIISTAVNPGEKALNALKELGKKLWYLDKANASNLNGSVEVAEGLTTEGKIIKVGDINFVDAVYTAEAEKDGETAVETEGLQGSTEILIKEVDEQNKFEFTSTITGNKDQDADPTQLPYMEAGVLKGDSYVFSGNTEIKIEGDSKHVVEAQKDVKIEAGNQILTLNANNKTNRDTSMIFVKAANGENRSLEIDAKELVLKVKKGAGTEAKGLVAEGASREDLKAVVDIKGDISVEAVTEKAEDGNYGLGRYPVAYGIQALDAAEITVDGNVKMHSADAWAVNLPSNHINAKGAAIAATAFKNMTGAPKINIKGNVDLKVNADAIVTENAGSEIKLEGGYIEVNKDGTAAYSAILNRGGNIIINIDESADAKVKSAGKNKVEIKGNIVAGAGQMDNLQDKDVEGCVELGLGTKDSAFSGVIYNALPAGGSEFNNHKFIESVNLYIANGAKWNNSAYGKLPTEKEAWHEDGQVAEFKGSRVTNMVGADSMEQVGVIYQNDDNPVTVENYSGNVAVIYKHDGSNAENMQGGDFIINKAEAGSNIRVITDNDGLAVNDLYEIKENATADDKNKIAASLNALAGKIFYKDISNNPDNLKGTVEIAEGLTTAKISMPIFKVFSQAESTNEAPVAGDSLKGEITWNKDAGDKFGQGQYIYKPAEEVIPEPEPKPDPEPENPDPKPTPEPVPDPNPDPEPKPIRPKTCVINAIESAMTTSMLAWREDLSDMNERLGDIRYGREELGVWARATGGKVSYKKDSNEFKNEFKGVQTGLDRKLANGTYVGAAFTYNDGDAKYNLGGKGENKLYGISLYGSKVFDDDSYLDVTAKINTVDNKVTAYTMFRYEVKGDYLAHGYGLSMEYGKRFHNDNKWVEPQAQLALGRLGSADYTLTTDYNDGRTLDVHQDAMNSVIGRIGIAAGVESESGSVYAKASLLHEFASDMTSSIYNSDFEGSGNLKYDREFDNTWGELALGGTYNLSDNSYLYGDFEKSFGGDFEVDWKVNAGLRFSF